MSSIWMNSESRQALNIQWASASCSCEQISVGFFLFNIPWVSHCILNEEHCTQTEAWRYRADNSEMITPLEFHSYVKKMPKEGYFHFLYLQWWLALYALKMSLNTVLLYWLYKKTHNYSLFHNELLGPCVYVRTTHKLT